jgi:hypothetical protein
MRIGMLTITKSSGEIDFKSFDPFSAGTSDFSSHYSQAASNILIKKELF